MDPRHKHSHTHPELWNALARLIQQTLNGDAAEGAGPMVWALVAAPVRQPGDPAEPVHSFVCNAHPPTLDRLLRNTADMVTQAEIAAAMEAKQAATGQTRQ